MSKATDPVDMNAGSSLLFQYYLDNHFKLPKVIRDDVVYCQRALKAHIKVHQMVTNVFREQKDLDPRQKSRILGEIESEIYEINAEQQFLFLRMRRIIDEFAKTVKRKNVDIDENAINMIVSQDIVPYIGDERYHVQPLTIAVRLSEQKLMHKYFEIEPDNRVVYEILDSDDDEDVGSVVLIDDARPPPLTRAPPQQPHAKSEVSPKNAAARNASNGNQMSLLKPADQRGLMNATASTKGGDANADKTTVSKNVKMSRLNLRQALNKARTETIAAKVAAKERATADAPPKTAAANAKTPAAMANAAKSQHCGAAPHTDEPRKKGDAKARTTRSGAADKHTSSASSSRAATPVGQTAKGVSELNSSSEDSNPDRELAQPSRSSSPADARTLPEHVGKELFLRLFDLYTPAMQLQMQQRRSKRKRRNVHSNERADFHYGRIEYGSYPPPEKKRKEFLLSPQVKRGRAPPAKRNGSTSPDEKRGCNECLKSGGYVDQCDECKGYFHPTCHHEDDEAKSPTAKKAPAPSTKEKFCPACKRAEHKLRLQVEAERHKALQTSAKCLEQKMAEEKERSSSLKQAGKAYKIQMQNLFNIVNTMKHDDDDDDDGDNDDRNNEATTTDK